MLAFELCSCHSGNTHRAKALGVFADVTVTSGVDDIRSADEEHPANTAKATAAVKIRIVSPYERSC